jgi:DNA-binding response OmpR family regulator
MPKILLIEEDHDMSEVLLHTLSKSGFTVHDKRAMRTESGIFLGFGLLSFYDWS